MTRYGLTRPVAFERAVELVAEGIFARCVRCAGFDQIALFVDEIVIFRIAEHVLVIRFELPFRKLQIGVELFHRAILDGIAHIGGKGARRRSTTLQSAHAHIVVPAHPDPGRDAGGKADEIAILVGACRTRLARYRPADIGGAAGPGGDCRLQQIRDPGSDIIGYQLRAARVALVLVKQVAIGRFDFQDAIGFDRIAACRHRGKGTRHVDQANLVRAKHHRWIGVDFGRDPEAPRHGRDRTEADFVAELRGDRIDRIGKGRAQIDFTDITARRIARAPPVDADRRIHHAVVGRVTGLERCEIDEQLPRRARLAAGIGGAIVIGLDVIGAADQREYRPVPVHADERTLRAIGRIGLYRCGGGPLHPHIERGPHLDRFECFGQQQVELRQSPVGEIADRVLARFFLELHGAGIDGRIGGDAALFLHQAQDDTGAAHCGIHIGRGRITAGRLDQPGDDRRFGGGEFGRRMAEEFAAGRIHAIGAAAEIDLVEIKLEDLFLRELRLQRHREHSFAQFAIERTVVVEKDVARQLLGNGRCCRHAPVTGRRGIDGADEAIGIDPEMRIISAVLDRDHRVLHHLWDFVGSQPLAVAGAEFNDLGPVACANNDGLRRLRRLELIIAGHRPGREDDGQADEQGDKDRQRPAPDDKAAHPELDPALRLVRCCARCAILARGALAAAPSLIHRLCRYPLLVAGSSRRPYKYRDIAWRGLIPPEWMRVKRQSSGSKSSAAELMQ